MAMVMVMVMAMVMAMAMVMVMVMVMAMVMAMAMAMVMVMVMAMAMAMWWSLFRNHYQDLVQLSLRRQSQTDSHLLEIHPTQQVYQNQPQL